MNFHNKKSLNKWQKKFRRIHHIENNHYILDLVQVYLYVENVQLNLLCTTVLFISINHIGI